MRAVKKIVLILVVLVAALAAGGFLLPRQVHVERTAVIDAPPATVFTVLNGFRLFNKWSPWYAKDPNARYTYEGPASGPGARESWVGDPKTVGSGSQTIVESVPGQRVASDLDFGPQGKAKAAFALAPEGQGTRVTWGLDCDMGAGPVGRYFGLAMDSMVGKDFDEGLGRLKTLVEAMPKADIAGLQVEETTAAPVTVAYVAATSPSKDLKAIAAAIGGAYHQVGSFMKAQGLKESGAPITINTRWDDAGYDFEAAIPVDRAPAKEVPADSPVKVKQTYAGKALKVVHKGPYATMHQTHTRLRAYLAASGYETAGPSWDEYVTDPGSTPEADLITNIFVPVK